MYLPAAVLAYPVLLVLQSLQQDLKFKRLTQETILIQRSRPTTSTAQPMMLRIQPKHDLSSLLLPQLMRMISSRHILHPVVTGLEIKQLATSTLLVYKLSKKSSAAAIANTDVACVCAVRRLLGDFVIDPESVDAGRRILSDGLRKLAIAVGLTEAAAKPLDILKLRWEFHDETDAGERSGLVLALWRTRDVHC